MAGFDKTFGSIKEYVVSEDRIWALFNYVFSDSCKKRNTYKFGLIKSILDNLFNGKQTDRGTFYTYEEIFSRFAENYWNLVTKYGLRQMRPDGKSTFSKVEVILKNVVAARPVSAMLEFQSLDDMVRADVIKLVTKECKRYVVGALYEDFDGLIYEFELSGNGLTLSPVFSEFMLKYKYEIEKLNYYAWAKFLEQENMNNDEALVRVLDKLELSTPRRADLSIYRELLYKEFEQSTCFYCGRKLRKTMQVDHFIPWDYVKDDKIWNFVLSCPECNSKKNNRLPRRDYIIQIVVRNKKIQQLNDIIIQRDFQEYSDDVIQRMWKYAMLCGKKEFEGVRCQTQ